MVVTLGNDIIKSYTGGVEVKEIYSNGVKVWPVGTPTHPDTEIWYVSTDNQVINPVPENSTALDEFGVNIISNTYTGNQGIITFDGSVTKMGGRWAEGGTAGRLSSISIPSSVTSIDSGAFVYCVSLTSVTIPSQVTVINRNAFDHSGLTSINIPSSVTTLGAESFGWCPDLSSVTLPPVLSVIGDNIFIGCTSLTNITIPEGYTTIGSGMFRDSGLTSIYIPASVTSIGSVAFVGCSNCAVIRVNSNNTVYDSRNNCSAIIKTSTNELIAGCALTTFPSTVTKIGQSAFEGNTNLRTITIPSTITSISQRAFLGCSNLAEVIMESTVPPTISSMPTCFDTGNPETQIKVPAEAYETYRRAPGWSNIYEMLVPMS